MQFLAGLIIYFEYFYLRKRLKGSHIILEYSKINCRFKKKNFTEYEQKRDMSYFLFFFDEVRKFQFAYWLRI